MNLMKQMAGCLLSLLAANCGAMAQQLADDAYFRKKHPALTAVWTSPFSHKEVDSRHAPGGPFLGNGDVGLTCYTTANSQTLLLSKVDFITDGWKDWSGDGPGALPAGGINIVVAADSAAGFRYEMDQLEAELRMTTGTVSPVRMVTWLSADDNYVVTELTTASSSPVPVTVETYAGGTTSVYATTAGVRGDMAQVTRRTNSGSTMRWVSQVGISSRIVGSKATVERVSASRVRSTFTLTAGRPVYVVGYVSGGGNDDNARLTLGAKKIKGASDRRIAALRASKAAWWKDMWTRSYVETNDSLLDRQYLSSIYLLASAANRHSPSCGGMYGVWNMNDSMNYHGDIHLNYNSQAGFYSVFSANRPELALPYYKSIDRLVPDGRRRAREELGRVHPSLKDKSCRGILFSVSALGNGYMYGEYWKQTVDAPFSIPIYNWYYEYTGDKRFLREEAYPYIRECGDFYEDYLQKETCGDTYRYCITTGAHENSWDLNPSSDLAFVELTFRLLLRYSELLGVDADRRALWRDIVDHLPAYKVIMPAKEPNEGKPVFAKNEAGWDWPNHVIQMHPVYPCELLNLRSDSTARQIARNTIYYYGVSQRGMTETMNELGLSAFVMGARVGLSPEVLVENMKTLIRRAGRNFLIRDGHHCMEKTAVVETINSMMLQSVEGVLYLFPCWLPSPASFTRLRAKGAFIVSASYDGREVQTLQIGSEHGGRCRMQNPWPGREMRVTDKGRSVSVEYEDGICSFVTRAGHTYKVEPVSSVTGR